ncbi:hypothetical protein BGZ96_003680 [Linnemannia gamsii]|uniref:Uncharacterized protein n=1 Tax=Linnemannia gamsii TaxID=64522 RepID=A0ABQ7K7Y7_9FUNG|nr:hypothetical protein BGZ96_003680 [Linnemannia gamsii]
MSGNGQQHRGSIHPTNGSPQVTDPLSFASRFFQQIGDTDLSPDDDDDSRSDESENLDESDQDDDDNQNQTSHQPPRSNGRQGPTLPTFSPRNPQGFGQKELSIAAQDQHTDGAVATNTTKHPKDLDEAQRHQEGPEAKRTKLEAVANLINSGISGRGDHQPTAATTTTASAKENKPFLNQSDLAQFNFSNKAADDTNAAHIQSTLQYLQQQQHHKQQQQRQQQQQLTTSSRPTPQQLIHLHQQQQQQQQQQLQSRLQNTSPQHSPQQPTTPVVKTENGPKRPYSVGSSIASSTPSPTTTKGISGGGVIDLTEDEAAAISDDDEVVIDESKTTAIANRNLCFGMIQSLVVTLYPRHLDYIEGKSDRVIIKRATTANKASLAVQHEGGLYGYIVSELAEMLVPLVDANMIWWEASVPRQRKHNVKTAQEEFIEHSNVSAPINIVLYGKPRFQMMVAKALYGKVKLVEPLSYDHRTCYSNPLAPVPGQQLSLYDQFRGVSTPSPYYNSGAGLGYTGYTSYAGYSGSSVRSAEDVKNQIDGVFKGLRSATDLPEVEPASTMATKMYRHQKQALYFLLEREKQEDYSDNEKNKLTSLWRVRQQLHRHPTYLNVVTSQETTLKPTSMLGGILADDMGLGKTITVISLIMATLDRKMHLPAPSIHSTPVPQSAAPDFLSSGDLVTEYDTPPSPTIRPMLTMAPKKPLQRRRLANQRTKSHATLIICPLSTVQNWEEQFEAHVKKDALQVYVYHGGQRVSDPAYLAKHDVVITTYNLLGTEYSKECKGKENESSASKNPSVLQHIDWFRVVLDEAHIIKEVNTVQSKAACALVAERRWCLTGTPIQNKLDDLFALVKFLGMQPFQEKAHWAHYISKPIKAANPIGITRLQTLMKVITLRRTKTQMVDGKPLLDLPPRTDHMRTLDLSLNERQMYQRMESSAKQTVSQIVQENKVMKNYAHILQAILKLRQICAHYALVKNMSDDLDMSGEFNLVKAAAIYSLLQDSGNDQCNSCFLSSTATPIVTRCEHVFCPECVKKLNPISYMLIQKGNANVSVASGLKSDFCCPQCTTSLKPIDLIQIQDDAEDKVETIGGGHIHSRTDDNGMFIHSTKVKALMEDLVQAGDISRRTGQPMVKSVVFSQWTSMLDLIEDGLRENKITFTRLDGTMQRNDRTAAMIKFKEKANCSVILISLKAGGVGLNLTSAQRVYLMDPHWNPSVESQAIDRIHRLGQTKPVDVVRFIIKESIEENILELQKRKAELSEMTFSEKLSKQEVLKRRLEDLKYLFQGSSELMKKRNAALANGESAASSPVPP